jgi:hypothetical protein
LLLSQPAGLLFFFGKEQKEKSFEAVQYAAKEFYAKSNNRCENSLRLINAIRRDKIMEK